jgi:hypothetical protein
MRASQTAIMFVIVCSGLVGCTTTQDSLLGERRTASPTSLDEPVELDPYNLPTSVRNTFLRQAQGSPLVATSKRSTSSGTEFRAYTTTNGKTYKLVADQDGRLLSMKSVDYTAR